MIRVSNLGRLYIPLHLLNSQLNIKFFKGLILGFTYVFLSITFFLTLSFKVFWTSVFCHSLINMLLINDILVFCILHKFPCVHNSSSPNSSLYVYYPTLTRSSRILKKNGEVWCLYMIFINILSSENLYNNSGRLGIYSFIFLQAVEKCDASRVWTWLKSKPL